MQELSTLNGLGASARGVLMGANTALASANARLRAAELQWGTLGQVGANVEIDVLNKWAEGKPLTRDEEAIRTKDSMTQHVFNTWKEIFDARKAQSDAEVKVTAAEEGVRPFVTWANDNMEAARRQAAENERKAEAAAAAAAKKGGKGQGASAQGKPGAPGAPKNTRRDTNVR